MAMVYGSDDAAVWEAESPDGDSCRVVVDARGVAVTVRFIDGARGGGVCAHEDFDAHFGGAVDAVFDPETRAEIDAALALYAARAGYDDDRIP